MFCDDTGSSFRGQHTHTREADGDLINTQEQSSPLATSPVTVQLVVPVQYTILYTVLLVPLLRLLDHDCVHKNSLYRFLCAVTRFSISRILLSFACNNVPQTGILVMGSEFSHYQFSSQSSTTGTTLRKKTRLQQR